MSDRSPTANRVLTSGVLSKKVPARVMTVRFNWINNNFMLFGTFKAARSRMRMDLGGYDKCFWCKTPFKEEDMMALAQPEKGKNRAMCQHCAAAAAAKKIEDANNAAYHGDIDGDLEGYDGA